VKNLKTSKIYEYIEKIQNGTIDVVEHTRKVLEDIEKINEKYNYFNSISKDLALAQAENISKNIKENNALQRFPLAGLPVSVKDCICVKGVESRGGSKILTGHKPLFNATAIQKLVDAGAIIIGKTSQDEFGFGSFNTNVGIGFATPKNPYDKERVCGGSSGGSAGITATADFPHVSIAESTGGSIACPASFCGVAGITPTYGMVSRYGLIDYANSLDKIGVMAKNSSDTLSILNIIKGKDHNDMTSLEIEEKDDHIEKIAVLDIEEGVSPDVMEKFNEKIDKMSEKYFVEKIKMPITKKFGIAAYYVIATSEASTNLAKYSGIRYGASGKFEGSFNEYFSKVRSANLGEEAKRRIMLGTFARMSGYRDAYYMKAMAVRKKIIDEYKELFKKYSAIISPTMPFVAPRFDEAKKLTPMQNYMSDILTVGPNLAGLPHLSINIGKSSKEDMPVGMMIIGDHGKEKTITHIGHSYEDKDA
jgi:aspartyl-tRNA(Asn)/glutamyl-tRNA(Gln) amidotransferase subunit A